MLLVASPHVRKSAAAVLPTIELDSETRSTRLVARSAAGRSIGGCCLVVLLLEVGKDWPLLANGKAVACRVEALAWYWTWPLRWD